MHVYVRTAGEVSGPLTVHDHVREPGARAWRAVSLERHVVVNCCCWAARVVQLARPPSISCSCMEADGRSTLMMILLSSISSSPIITTVLFLLDSMHLQLINLISVCN